MISDCSKNEISGTTDMHSTRHSTSTDNRLRAFFKWNSDTLALLPVTVA